MYSHCWNSSGAVGATLLSSPSTSGLANMAVLYVSGSMESLCPPSNQQIAPALPPARTAPRCMASRRRGPRPVRFHLQSRVTVLCVEARFKHVRVSFWGAFQSPNAPDSAEIALHYGSLSLRRWCVRSISRLMGIQSKRFWNVVGTALVHIILGGQLATPLGLGVAVTSRARVIVLKCP